MLLRNMLWNISYISVEPNKSLAFQFSGIIYHVENHKHEAWATL